MEIRVASPELRQETIAFVRTGQRIEQGGKGRGERTGKHSNYFSEETSADGALPFRTNMAEWSAHQPVVTLTHGSAVLFSSPVLFSPGRLTPCPPLQPLPVSLVFCSFSFRARPSWQKLRARQSQEMSCVSVFLSYVFLHSVSSALPLVAGRRSCGKRKRSC